MKTKIVLPEKFTNTIIQIAKRDNLIDFYDFNNNFNNDFNNDLSLRINNKINKKIEQQFYQILFLYDEVILIDFNFELYDITKLLKFDNISFFDFEMQNRMIGMGRLNHIVPNIEFDFSQYIKPAIIHDIKHNMAPFYEIKKANFSDYQFASKFYDMLFLDKENGQLLADKYSKIYDVNARYYYEYGKIILERENVRKNEFFDNMLAIISLHLDRVLRDFELSNNMDAVILDPDYSIEKLGMSSKKIKDLNDIYGTLKVECNKLIPTLPQFSSIYEVLKFKENKSKDIKRLREEIYQLENILINEGKEKMIIKAAEDVKKAATEINHGEETSLIDKWSIYLALPAGLLEYYYSFPPIISMPISIYGVSSYFKKKYIHKKNNWVRIVR